MTPELGPGTLRFTVGGVGHRVDLGAYEVRAVLACVRNCRHGRYERTRELSSVEARKARRLSGSGMSLDEIAMRMECSPTSIVQALRRSRMGGGDDLV